MGEEGCRSIIWSKKRGGGHKGNGLKRKEKKEGKIKLRIQTKQGEVYLWCGFFPMLALSRHGSAPDPYSL